MKGGRGDEEDLVGLQLPIFGRDRFALDQRQQVALHALTAHRAAAHVADRDLVDLVEEDDPARLGIGKRDARDIVLIQALVLLRSEEHTSELQSPMRISYSVFCLKKNKNHSTRRQPHNSVPTETRHTIKI